MAVGTEVADAVADVTAVAVAVAKAVAVAVATVVVAEAVATVHEVEDVAAVVAVEPATMPLLKPAKPTCARSEVRLCIGADGAPIGEATRLKRIAIWMRTSLEFRRKRLRRTHLLLQVQFNPLCCRPSSGATRKIFSGPLPSLVSLVAMAAPSTVLPSLPSSEGD